MPAGGHENCPSAVTRSARHDLTIPAGYAAGVPFPAWQNGRHAPPGSAGSLGSPPHPASSPANGTTPALHRRQRAGPDPRRLTCVQDQRLKDSISVSRGTIHALLRWRFRMAPPAQPRAHDCAQPQGPAHSRLLCDLDDPDGRTPAVVLHADVVCSHVAPRDNPRRERDVQGHRSPPPQ